MNNILRIKANDIDDSFISKIKNNFKDKEILVSEIESIEILENSIKNIESSANLKSFSLSEFDKYSDELVRDKK